MSEIKINVGQGAEDYAIEVLNRLLAPHTPEQAAADDLRYRQMIYRLYNLLVNLNTDPKYVERLNLNIPFPCHFPWDEFTKLNPSVKLHVKALEQEQQHELSDIQCHKAVMALLSYPNGPRIEITPESPR